MQSPNWIPSFLFAISEKLQFFLFHVFFNCEEVAAAGKQVVSILLYALIFYYDCYERRDKKGPLFD